MFKGGKYKIQQEYYSLAQFTYHLFSNRLYNITGTAELLKLIYQWLEWLSLG
jgi:hypothetical protein